jgi:non-heme chloroperoxidase
VVTQFFPSSNEPISLPQLTDDAETANLWSKALWYGHACIKMNSLGLVAAILVLTICLSIAAEPTALESVRVNGVELHYLMRGSGQALVFVHGALDDYRMWEPEIEPFAREYHVVDYSRRYSFPNQNAPPVSDYSAITDAEDLAGLIQKLQLGPAHIVAHSYGGYAALYLTVRHPELVRSLVLAEPAVVSWAKENPESRLLFTEQMENLWRPARDAFRFGNKEDTLRIALDYFESKGAYDRLPDAAKKQLREDLPEWRALATSRDAFPLLRPHEVARIEKPVLLLTGENTQKIFAFIDEELKRVLPKARDVIIPQAKHEMWAENEEACRSATLEFLKQQRQAEN